MKLYRRIIPYFRTTTPEVLRIRNCQHEWGDPYREKDEKNVSDLIYSRCVTCKHLSYLIEDQRQVNASAIMPESLPSLFPSPEDRAD